MVRVRQRSTHVDCRSSVEYVCEREREREREKRDMQESETCECKQLYV